MSTYSFNEATPSAVDAAESPDVKSAYELFREQMNHPAVLETTKSFDVEGRPGVSAEYATDLDYAILQRYIQNNTKKNKTDMLAVCNSILIYLNRGFRFHGDLVEKDGSPVTFATDEFQKFANNSLDARSAIRWFYGKDSYVIATGMAVLDAAGYADFEVSESENPTQKD